VPEPDAYLAELARRLAAILGDDLVGVYGGGSYALGAYRPGRSDIDVAAVVASALTPAAKDTIVAALRHEELPCPARGLELVVYRLGASDFELNLNTGETMPFRVDHQPDPAESHWFALDRAILRERGVPIVGPPPGDVFDALPRTELLPIVAQSLRWHLGGEAREDDMVLNACRSLRYALTDEWTSKPDAGRWALQHVEETRLVEAALAGAAIEPEHAAAFVRVILERINA
jgi:predicted nucleotidyltransferase